MKAKCKKQDVINRMCRIQREFDDGVLFHVGVTDNGKKIDILSADNLLLKSNNKGDEKKAKFQVEFPEKPDYVA